MTFVIARFHVLGSRLARLLTRLSPLVSDLVFWFKGLRVRGIKVPDLLLGYTLNFISTC